MKPTKPTITVKGHDMSLMKRFAAAFTPPDGKRIYEILAADERLREVAAFLSEHYHDWTEKKKKRRSV